MAASVTAMNDGGSYGVTEHAFKRLLPGDVEGVRQRLIPALESQGYMVLAEQPIHAQRGGSLSFNILECPLKLTIALRQANAGSTIATFSYTIPLSMVTRGDLQTVEREAEAIIALATIHPTADTCAMCGTNSTGDSRYCRRCGAPLAEHAPGELEVLRLTAGARAGHQTIVTGIIVILSVLAMTVPLILLGRPKGVTAGWVLLIIGQLTGWLTLLYGAARLHRTLNPKTALPQMQPSARRQSMPHIEAAALPPQSAWASVTEGTTELLGVVDREKVVAPVKQKSEDTGSIT